MPATHFALLCVCLVAVGAIAAPVDLAPREFADAVQPQVAVAPGGRFHVVFGKGNAIFHTSSPDGRTFTAPVRVGELDKLALRMRRGPRLAATDQSITITAISHTDGNLHAWTSGDHGATWQEGQRLNEPARSAREGLHAMIGDGRGFIATAWLDLRNGGMELWSRVSRDAGATWAPEVRVYASPDGQICACCHPSLALGPGGEVIAMWRNALGGARDLWMAESRDGGRTFGPAQKLGSGSWKLNACPMDGGAIAVAADGTATSVWRREKAVFLSTAANREERLADGSTQPVIAIADGIPVVIWEEAGGLKIQRDHEPPAWLARNARAPALAALPKGGFIAVWESSANGISSLQSEVCPR
jgi:hypothetical protein